MVKMFYSAVITKINKVNDDSFTIQFKILPKKTKTTLSYYKKKIDYSHKYENTKEIKIYDSTIKETFHYTINLYFNTRKVESNNENLTQILLSHFFPIITENNQICYHPSNWKQLNERLNLYTEAKTQQDFNHYWNTYMRNTCYACYEKLENWEVLYYLSLSQKSQKEAKEIIKELQAVQCENCHNWIHQSCIHQEELDCPACNKEQAFYITQEKEENTTEDTHEVIISHEDFNKNYQELKDFIEYFNCEDNEWYVAIRENSQEQLKILWKTKVKELFQNQKTLHDIMVYCAISEHKELNAFYRKLIKGFKEFKANPSIENEKLLRFWIVKDTPKNNAIFKSRINDLENHPVQSNINNYILMKLAFCVKDNTIWKLLWETLKTPDIPKLLEELTQLMNQTASTWGQNRRYVIARVRHIITQLEPNVSKSLFIGEATWLNTLFQERNEAAISFGIRFVKELQDKSIITFEQILEPLMMTQNIEIIRGAIYNNHIEPWKIIEIERKQHLPWLLLIYHFTFRETPSRINYYMSAVEHLNLDMMKYIVKYMPETISVEVDIVLKLLREKECNIFNDVIQIIQNDSYKMKVLLGGAVDEIKKNNDTFEILDEIYKCLKKEVFFVNVIYQILLDIINKNKYDKEFNLKLLKYDIQMKHTIFEAPYEDIIKFILIVYGENDTNFINLFNIQEFITTLKSYCEVLPVPEFVKFSTRILNKYKATLYNNAHLEEDHSKYLKEFIIAIEQVKITDKYIYRWNNYLFNQHPNVIKKLSYSTTTGYMDRVIQFIREIPEIHIQYFLYMHFLNCISTKNHGDNEFKYFISQCWFDKSYSCEETDIKKIEDIMDEKLYTLNYNYNDILTFAISHNIFPLIIQHFGEKLLNPHHLNSQVMNNIIKNNDGESFLYMTNRFKDYLNEKNINDYWKYALEHSSKLEFLQLIYQNYKEQIYSQKEMNEASINFVRKGQYDIFKWLLTLEGNHKIDVHTNNNIIYFYLLENNALLHTLIKMGETDKERYIGKEHLIHSLYEFLSNYHSGDRSNRSHSYIKQRIIDIYNELIQ